MKNVLRQQLKEKRRGLATGLYAEKSKRITEQLLTVQEYKKAQRILFYVSLPEEVDTHTLIKEALSSGKIIFVPKIDGSHLMVCPLNEFHELQPGQFGILEPCTPAEDRYDFDLIVVPGVGFDNRGHRLGYGKGHYDRLLKETKGYKVGLAFEEQLVPELPIEDHDVPMDMLITDQNLFRFPHP